MKNNQIQKNIPNGWSIVPLGSLGEIVTGNTPSTKDSSNYIGSHCWATAEDFKSKYIFDTNIKLSDSGKKYSRFLPIGSILVTCIASIGKNAIAKVPLATNQQINAIIVNSKNNNEFVYYWIQNSVPLLKRTAGAGAMQILNKNEFSKLKICVPPSPEQKRIVSVLETWDKAIEILAKKIEFKKNIKKGLMQRLLTGKIRLPGFSEKWQTLEIGELLDYEQPTKYIVNNTDYKDYHKTPVLTANKGFILGFTNETDGIYNNSPVIIFDDFTMDNKYIDFEFKVKSSAIKILTAKTKEVNLKFIFEKIQLLNIIIGQHRRHYLSEYQYITMDVPNIKEQAAIANVSICFDKEITNLEKKLSIIKKQKNYLLDNLITGTIRTPETMKTKL
jgi:type I restriction enzyme S subunit